LASTDTVETVAVIIADDRLVDYIIHNASAWHEAKLDYVRSEGGVQLMFRGNRDSLYVGDSDSPFEFTETYVVGRDGFTRTN